MEREILIKGAGILYQEIILTALQEYRKQCKKNGSHCRSEVVNDIIKSIEFII